MKSIIYICFIYLFIFFLQTTPFIGFTSFGAPGVEFYGQLPKDKIICSLHFVPGRVSLNKQNIYNYSSVLYSIGTGYCSL